MLFGIIVRWTFRPAHAFETDLSAPANFKHITQRNDWSELLALDKAECLDHDILYSIENHKITTTQNPFRGFGPRPCSLIRFFPYTASTIKHSERGEWEKQRERERERQGKTQPRTTWERFIDLQSRVRRKHRFHLLSLPKENSISERARRKSPGWNLIPPVFCFSSQTCFSFRYLRDSSICRVGKLNSKLRTQNLICRVVESTVWTVQLNLIRMEWCCTTPNNSPCGGQSYQLVVTLNLSYMTPQHQEQCWQLC